MISACPTMARAWVPLERDLLERIRDLGGSDESVEEILRGLLSEAESGRAH